MLVRRIARPLFAASFVVDALDALRTPAPHAARVEALWERVGRRVDLPPVPSRTQLLLITRVHGGAVLVCATLLAVGKAPRLAALGLAGLTLPVVAAHTPDRPQQGDAELWRAVSQVGGAMLAALDTEGRPGIAWRVEHAAADRAAAKQARAAVAQAGKEARAAVRAVRSEASTGR